MCLRSLSRIISHQWYSNKSASLKTPQGIYEWFVTCLLDQSVNPEHHFRTVNGLRKGGWLDQEAQLNLIQLDPAKLETDLREALKSYRFPNRATKAILTNLEKIEKEYAGNLHNIYNFAKEQFGEDGDKVTLEVWRRVNSMYWYGTKKAGVFIRELVTQGLWDLPLELLPIPPDSRVRRVMFRLGLVKDRNDFKEIEAVAKKLAKKAKITPLDLDCVLWTVGDEGICGEQKTFCDKCPLDFACPKGT